MFPETRHFFFFWPKQRTAKALIRHKTHFLMVRLKLFFHTCHTLWTEICEIRQMFKGDFIKFCEIVTKVTLKRPQNSQKPLFKCKNLVINTKKV